LNPSIAVWKEGKKVGKEGEGREGGRECWVWNLKDR
jgi:hypothetical protein